MRVRIVSRLSAARSAMRGIVIGVLVAARERWPRLSITDRAGIVKHLRVIANLLEESIHKEKCD